jgi:hypothetical protein
MTLDSHIYDDISLVKESLLRQVAEFVPEQVLDSIIQSEFEWHINPVQFLDRHFTPDKVIRRRSALTLEAFVALLGEEASEEEKELALHVYCDMRDQDDKRAQKWAAFARIGQT